MDPRILSTILLFMVKRVFFQFTDSNQIRVFFEPDDPWVVDLIYGKYIYLYSCLAASVPPSKQKRVDTACGLVEAAFSDFRCRSLNGKVELFYVIPAEASFDNNDEEAGKSCYHQLPVFKAAMDFAVSQLVFAIESSPIDRALAAILGTRYDIGWTPDFMTDVEGSALRRDMRLRRVIESVRLLGVLDPELVERTDTDGARSKPRRERGRGRSSDSARRSPKREKSSRLPFGHSLAVGVLCWLTVLSLIVQIVFSGTLPFGSPPTVLGIRAEFLFYACVALLLGIFIPSASAGKRPLAVGATVCAASLLYTGGVILSNNLWRFLERMNDYVVLKERGYIDSVFAGYRFLLVSDLRYDVGLAEYRYPLVFSAAAAIILLGFAYRFAKRRAGFPFRRGRRRSFARF